MVFNATFNNISAISWRNPEFPDKTIDMLQVNVFTLTFWTEPVEGRVTEVFIITS
jgi:hypothetical protein